MYQCFHCLQNTVYWSGDFSFEDYGYEGEGIIHECICANCGARITYMVPIEEEIQVPCERCTDECPNPFACDKYIAFAYAEMEEEERKEE